MILVIKRFIGFNFNFFLHHQNENPENLLLYCIFSFWNPQRKGMIKFNLMYGISRTVVQKLIHLLRFLVILIAGQKL